MDKAALKICLQHLSAPGAQERLRRAFDLILQAAARAEESNENVSDPSALIDGKVVSHE